MWGVNEVNRSRLRAVPTQWIPGSFPCLSFGIRSSFSDSGNHKVQWVGNRWMLIISDPANLNYWSLVQNVKLILRPNHVYKNPLFSVKHTHTHTHTQGLCDMPNHYSICMCLFLALLFSSWFSCLLKYWYHCSTIFYLHLMGQVWFSGKTLRRRSVCRKFISECSGD